MNSSRAEKELEYVHRNNVLLLLRHYKLAMFIRLERLFEIRKLEYQHFPKKKIVAIEENQKLKKIEKTFFFITRNI